MADNEFYVRVNRKRIGDLLSHEEFNEILDAIQGEGNIIGIKTSHIRVVGFGTFGGDLAVSKTLTAMGSMNIGGNGRISGTLHVGSTVSTGGKLTVGSGGADIGGILTVSGTSDLKGSVKVGQNLNVEKAIKGKSLEITEGSTLRGALSVNGKITGNNELELAGTARINTLSVSGASTFSNNVNVTGKITSNNLEVNGNSNLANLNVGGAVTLGNTLNVDGAVTFGNTLSIDGKITGNSGLEITGNTNLENLTIAGPGVAKVYQLTVDDNANISGDLEVTGNITSDGNVEASELKGGAYSKLKTEWGENITAATTPIINDIGTDTTTGTVKYRITQLEGLSDAIATAGNIVGRVDDLETTATDIITRIDVLDGGNLPNIIYVNNSTGDDTTATGEQSKPFKSLQAAINKVPPNGLIYNINCTNGNYGNLEVNSSSIDSDLAYRKNIIIHLNGDSTIESLHVFRSDVLFSMTGMNTRLTCTKGIYVSDNSYLKINASLQSVDSIIRYFIVSRNSRLIYRHYGGSFICTLKNNENSIPCEFANVCELSAMCIIIDNGSITINDESGSGTGFVSDGSTIYLPATNITNNATTPQQKINGGQIFSS